MVVHCLDGQEEFRDGALWLPCTRGWCVPFGDRIATSLINEHLGRMYSTRGGLIYRTSAHTNRVLCAWAGDGGTMNIQCSADERVAGKCVQGCYAHGKASWCTGMAGGCPHPPDAIKRMMDSQALINPVGYNEVILDSATFVRNLPHSLEAFFVTNTAEGWEERAKIKEAHARFVAVHGLVRGTPDYVPLLEWTTDGPKDHQRPRKWPHGPFVELA